MRYFVFTTFMILWSSTIYAETLAIARTSTRQFILETWGDPWKEDCDLVLSSTKLNRTTKISLKHESGLCALFGPVLLTAADNTDHKSSIVFVEAAHGGDGDHSGPILEVFSIRNSKFQKLGAQELYDAHYQRRNDMIVSVEGKVLFSFCDVCDGPEAADPEDNIFVPAKLTLGCGGICVKPHLTSRERNALIQSFNTAKAKAGKDNAELLAYIKYLELSFNEFLHRK